MPRKWREKTVKWSPFAGNQLDNFANTPRSPECVPRPTEKSDILNAFHYSCRWRRVEKVFETNNSDSHTRPTTSNRTTFIPFRCSPLITENAREIIFNILKSCEIAVGPSASFRDVCFIRSNNNGDGIGNSSSYQSTASCVETPWMVGGRQRINVSDRIINMNMRYDLKIFSVLALLSLLFASRPTTIPCQCHSWLNNRKPVEWRGEFGWMNRISDEHMLLNLPIKLSHWIHLLHIHVAISFRLWLLSQPPCSIQTELIWENEFMNWIDAILRDRWICWNPLAEFFKEDSSMNLFKRSHISTNN